MGNDYNDCVLTYGKLTLAYQTGTYANFGVTTTSQNTSPYNTYGRIGRAIPQTGHMYPDLMAAN